MRTQTGRKTRISISEKVCTNIKVHPAMQRENKIIMHDGWEWYIGKIHNEKELKEVLNFLEIELTDIVYEVKWKTTGKIVFYNLSKNINSSCDGGFWSIEQLEEMSKGQKLKKFKGLSNGSIVDCYIGIGENTIDIYRPNPNAKEVYKPMDHYEELNYRKNNWYL
jgi:hypothetical protein